MIRRRISEAQRSQIIGTYTTGMSFKAIGRQMGYHYTVVSQLMRKHTQTNNVKDLPRSSIPRVTSDRDDRALQRLVRRRVEAVIQARGCYTQYWTLNNRCRQVIHKWRFESEMTILSCFLNCEGQYLKWTCFTAKTGLVILWLNIH
jgi:hypothetical protein